MMVIAIFVTVLLHQSSLVNKSMNRSKKRIGSTP